MTPLAIRVALADDHPVIRLGVRSALDEAPAIHCIGTASNSTELMELLQREACDVVVTDYAMPGGAYGDGLELLDYLHARFPQLRVVVMTGLDQPSLLAALDARAVPGILSKGDDLQHVQAAVMAAYAQRRYVSPSVAQVLNDKERRRVTELSPSEQRVIALFISGLSIAEIAAQLDRKKQTISTQKINAMRKLGIARDAELFTLAADLGLKDSTG
ncbi:response regulator [Stenotrophomonas beteli]|uniref:LuxR family transcriptional regulator n=1 Tax=Stenotrophomonas beteli TaxID=3384461 RepID=A0A0R0BG55_9GAMM|nr:response regulator transcription factor [Stenotrophomonas maltophilia]KRG52529.1 LuxR family transcriptional regulator [Stenotrophomonas maltophilia]